MIALSIASKSWASAIPVGAKMVFLAVSSVLLFSVSDLVLLSGILCAALGLYLSLGIATCKKGLESLLPLIWILGLILIFHGFRGELYDGFEIVLRIAILAMLANFVTMTSKLSAMINFIIWLASPLKILGIKTASFGLAFAIVIRFTPVLIQRASNLSLAWRARAKSRGSWRIIMPMFISVIDDAENISEALRARGGAR